MRFLAFVIALLFAVSAQAGYRMHYKISGKKKELVSVSANTVMLAAGERRLVRSTPYYMHSEDKVLRDIWYEEYEVGESHVPASFFSSLADEVQIANSEMRVLVNQGPKENRINLTILGDGYTLAEKERFFADCERTVRGLFEGRTFASYLPLFNVYAVFVPSAVSGIGDGSPKNTAFKLYRDPPGSKRAIMPGDEAALGRALRLAPATDYPIVLANDEYYGGLGGRYAISTRSEATGLIVLRHELGHNFGEVGEEYDNGYVYRGANASQSASNVPWAHWVQGQTPVHEAKLMSGDYVWKNLRDGKYTAQFTIPNMIEKMLFVLSSVGWDTENDVEVKLNGTPLRYDGVFHDDRSFFDVEPQNVVKGQSYQLTIEEKVKDNDNVLGFALAYGLPANYDMTPNKVGAFASYSSGGSKSFRPTHNSCLMKNMEVDHFCVVDQENMWVKFFGRVRLIDSLKIETNGSEKQAVLSLQNLDSGLDIKWFSISGGSETEIVEARNQTRLATTRLSGSVKVKVEFRTPEVRKYTPKFNDTATVAL
jgi:hypothetical protein